MDVVTQNVPYTATFLLGGIGFLTVLYFLLSAIYNLYFHPLAKIPGHRAWSATHIPLAWSIYRGTSVRKMQQLHRQYGPILRIGPDSVSFAQAEAWAHVLQPPPGSPETILKDTQWFRPLPGMVPSLSQAVEPSPHAHIKKAMLPAFTARALRAQEPFIQRYVNLLVDRLRDIASGDSSSFFVGEHAPAEVDIVSWLNFTTFDIFGDLGFGESFGCLEHSRHHPWVSIIFSNLKGIALLRAASYFPIVESLLTLCIPASIRKMQSDHVEFVRKKVETRLNYEFKREDLMSCVYRAEGHHEFTENQDRRLREKSEQEGGGGLSVEAITSVFWEMIMAGSETTATSLAGTINLLVQNPDKLRILADELRTRFDVETSDSISLDELHDLPYLNAVLKEGLRLCAPFPWILPRVIPTGGGNICGAWLPEGVSSSPVNFVMYPPC